MLGCEDLAVITATLRQLLATVGDEAFAAHLSAEPAPVRSGVSWFLTAVHLIDAPKTRAVVGLTREYDFEVQRSLRSNQ
jgi:hypothetical protein